MSNTSKGNYYKKKTQTWFEKQGYFVVLTEFKSTIPVGPGRVIWVTKDILGADGIAMKKSTNEFIMWNSKGVSTIDSRDTHKSKGKKDFSIFPFPDKITRQIILWMPRVKDPQVVPCTECVDKVQVPAPKIPKK